MKFGKQLRDTVEKSYEEWRPKFINYKMLKKTLHTRRRLMDTTTHGDASGSERRGASDRETCNGVDDGDVRSTIRVDEEEREDGVVTNERETTSRQFFALLRSEVDKVNDFYVDKQEDYVIEHATLSNLVRLHLQTFHDPSTLTTTTTTTTSDPSSAHRTQRNRLLHRLTQLHAHLVLLDIFSVVNCTAIRKILKKHDKKTGLRLRHIFLHAVGHTPLGVSRTVRRLIGSTEWHLLAFHEAQGVVHAVPRPRRVLSVSALTSLNGQVGQAHGDGGGGGGGGDVEMFRHTRECSSPRGERSRRTSSQARSLSSVSAFLSDGCVGSASSRKRKRSPEPRRRHEI